VARAKTFFTLPQYVSKPYSYFQRQTQNVKAAKPTKKTSGSDLYGQFLYIITTM